MVDVSLKINTFSFPVCVSINFLSFVSLVFVLNRPAKRHRERKTRREEISFVSHLEQMNVNKRCLRSRSLLASRDFLSVSALEEACLLLRSFVVWQRRQDVTTVVKQRANSIDTRPFASAPIFIRSILTLFRWRETLRICHFTSFDSSRLSDRTNENEIRK